MVPGQVFQGKQYPYVHLHIVLSHPTSDGEVVVVNLTEQDSDKDSSCILKPGDHPSLTKASTVYYRMACFFQSDALDDAVKAHLVDEREPLTDDVFQLVLDGASVSKAFKPKFKRILLEQGLIGS